MLEIWCTVEEQGYEITYIYCAPLSPQKQCHTDLYNAYYSKAYGVKCKYDVHTCRTCPKFGITFLQVPAVYRLMQLT
ncbi:hypothetical protein M427DRAFT_38904 [Gonapodya prolifera JEL478]|uniref:Uncharacterized protein n=1 Tax=Gonapodya prolifera (strain JEL478) TaxID=1344416 RepID=A0A138ZY51_GONPJ|nr:hypothetical protein M427DRAFT_38904 [Gonapodya prolifera JEL478]|eukprot:KXS09432.1 hypothetical protein M427DRAFT_38904 [Gonapodya prolifera JEL478]